MWTVSRNAVSTLRMVAGNENKYPIVILDGILKEWVGIGWIGEGKASIEDKRKYPTVK